MKLHYALGSHRGLVRSNNEDSAYAGPYLLALADGMGGHAAGEVASQMMINYLAEIDADPGENDMLALLGSVADDANRALARGVREKPEIEGMGTTLTALMFNGDELGLCHVGDSRGFRMRAGTLERITVDDTYVQSLVDKGQLDPADISTHPQRSMILKAYTGRPVEPTLEHLDARIGDRLMLCSDGLSDPVTTDTIADELAYGTPEEAVRRLIDLALRSGGPDNVTVVVADIVADDIDPATLPATPLTAGALNNEEEPPQINTAAGRAAAALATVTARQPEVIPPHPQQAKEAPQSSRRFIPVIAFMLALLVSGGGFLAAQSYAADRYFISLNDQQEFIISQGLKTPGLSALGVKAYQAACINAAGNLTFVDNSERPDCAIFSLNDLNEPARALVGNFSGGRYDEVIQQMQRLSEEALPVCVTRQKVEETTSPRTTSTPRATRTPSSTTTPPTSTSAPRSQTRTTTSSVRTTPQSQSSAAPSRPGDLSTPGVNCREVKNP
ncbi:protein phosphatase 2C domain-containing protein [Corynebacterium sp. ES2794-CONJ1]|uniref:PP2C family protein-serine/threonine phosphatase n=1 Tax=Corynebacterium sp. ES2794-CONJ1 TaxID=2980553 RepID=UPI0021D99533|nr:protein phosphatase 2C domain-containing protein [Corynebacterium sp. ES2794-CONJ1]MCU9519719.1 protein phosphatase 2C domain-containing protein [Corynebacterium sp. ES2794-CONJ1]